MAEHVEVRWRVEGVSDWQSGWVYIDGDHEDRQHRVVRIECAVEAVADGEVVEWEEV